MDPDLAVRRIAMAQEKMLNWIFLLSREICNNSEGC